MKSCLPVKIESHRFVPRDFIGGDAALDFINTVTGRDQSPRDWLDSYTALLGWAALVRLLPGNILRALTRKAKSEPRSEERRVGKEWRCQGGRCGGRRGA